MPRLGLSYNAVKEAAERLEAQGQVPTVMRVRNEVGGTGSLSTIARHLKEWRQLHGPQVPNGGALALNPEAASAQGSEVPAEVGQIARSAWQRLTDLAAEQIAEVRASCQAEQERVEAAAAQQVEQATRQAAAAEAEARREVDAARVAEAQARTQAESERQERQSIGARATSQEAAAAAAQATAEQRLKGSAAEVEALSKRLAHSELGRHKAEEARDMALERQRSSEAQCAARMDKAAHLEQQRLASMTQSFERLVASLRQDEAKAKAELARHQQALTGLRERLAAREDAVLQLQQRAQAGKEAAQERDARLARAEAELAQEREQRTSLLQELKARAAAQPATESALRSIAATLQKVETRLSERP